MRPWNYRALEERGLFAPSFTALLLWQAAYGHKSGKSSPLSFMECFVVLPMTLESRTRDILPRAVTTSLVAWLEEHPLVRSSIGENARMLVPFTKEALTFAGSHNLISIQDGFILPNTSFQKKINEFIKKSDDDVTKMMKKSDFIGRWFMKTGAASTVMGLLGVRP